MLSFVAELKVLGSFFISSRSCDFVNMFSFGIKSGKVVRYHVSDRRRDPCLRSALTQASSICLSLAWTALESAAFS